MSKEEEWAEYVHKRIAFLEAEESEHRKNGTLTEEMEIDYIQRTNFLFDSLLP